MSFIKGLLGKSYKLSTSDKFDEYMKALGGFFFFKYAIGSLIIEARK